MIALFHRIDGQPDSTPLSESPSSLAAAGAATGVRRAPVQVPPPSTHRVERPSYAAKVKLSGWSAHFIVLSLDSTWNFCDLNST